MKVGGDHDNDDNLKSIDPTTTRNTDHKNGATSTLTSTLTSTSAATEEEESMAAYGSIIMNHTDETPINNNNNNHDIMNTNDDSFQSVENNDIHVDIDIGEMNDHNNFTNDNIMEYTDDDDDDDNNDKVENCIQQDEGEDEVYSYGSSDPSTISSKFSNSFRNSNRYYHSQSIRGLGVEDDDDDDDDGIEAEEKLLQNSGNRNLGIYGSIQSSSLKNNRYLLPRFDKMSNGHHNNNTITTTDDPNNSHDHNGDGNGGDHHARGNDDTDFMLLLQRQSSYTKQNNRVISLLLFAIVFFCIVAMTFLASPIANNDISLSNNNNYSRSSSNGSSRQQTNKSSFTNNNNNNNNDDDKYDDDHTLSSSSYYRYVHQHTIDKVPFTSISRDESGSIPASSIVDPTLFHPLLLNDKHDITNNNINGTTTTTSLQPFLITPFPTGAFYTNFFLKQTTNDDDTLMSYPIMVYPYAYKWSPTHIIVSYPYVHRIYDSNSIRDIFQNDISFSVMETMNRRFCSNFDALSLTIRYTSLDNDDELKQQEEEEGVEDHQQQGGGNTNSGSDGNNNMDMGFESYLVQGSPYITMKYTNSTPVLSALSTFQSFHCLDDDNKESTNSGGADNDNSVNENENNLQQSSNDSTLRGSKTNSSPSSNNDDEVVGKNDFGICSKVVKASSLPPSQQSVTLRGVQFIMQSQENLKWLVFSLFRN
jgi:hypothetical protein